MDEPLTPDRKAECYRIFAASLAELDLDGVGRNAKDQPRIFGPEGRDTVDAARLHIDAQAVRPAEFDQLGGVVRRQRMQVPENQGNQVVAGCDFDLRNRASGFE